ncbi:MAG: DedA family protein [Candidatus Symbiobacter sp.]|nr:DedA family protein [Candidatus Symbiobacter sp.]
MTDSLLNFFHSSFDQYGEYGLTLLVFIWTALEGETIVIIAGFYAQKGLIHLYYLIPAAWIGSFIGDQIYFTLGRKYGPRLLARRPKWQAGVNRALALFERYDTLFILSFRFIYGVRNFSSVAMGLSNVAWARFAYLNFIAAGIWATSFSLLGYGLAHIFVRDEADASGLAHWIGISMLMLFVVAIILIVRHNRRRSAQKQEEKLD